MTTQTRAKYTDDDRHAMAKAGQAMPDGSYPVKDADDLDNAIHAVGRGGADHDAIRRHIIGRAKALGLSSRIPDNWGADGSLKGSSSSGAPLELRRRRGSMFGRPERRRLPAQFELRAMPDGTGGSMYELNFYASTFNDPFPMWDQWGEPYDEVVRPGGFTQTLARPDLDTSLLLGHNDAGLPYARTTNGKVRLAQDTRGLHVNAQRLNGKRSDVRDMVIAVEDGDLSEASVGFITRQQKWSEDWQLREMLSLDLHRGDVSLVTFGANPATKGASVIAMPGESAWGASWQPGTEGRAASHGPYSGTHSHAHPAYGSQGGDGSHEHEHSHDDDADHDHMHPHVGPNDRADGRAHEHREADQIVDNGGPPDSNVDLSANGVDSVKCPYTVANGCGMMNSGSNKFCGNCGGPLYSSDGTLVLDDSGVIESVESTGDANLLSMRLRLLELT